MSILRSLLPERREATLSEALLAFRDQRSGHSDVYVTADSAMRHSAVWSSVNHIADLVSSLPVDEFRGRGASKVEVDPSPVIAAPNAGVVSRVQWLRQVLVSLLLRGNAWGLVVERDPRLFVPTRIEVVNPDDVGVRRVGKLGRLEVTWDGTIVAPDDLWHVAAYTYPGSPVGLSPISYAASVIGLGHMAHRFGSDWFRDGAHPSGVLSNDQTKTVGTDDQAKAVKDRFTRAISGREPVVLGGAWKYHQIQIAPEESQFLDTIRANRGMIATIFGLRPEDVGESSGDSNTYANVEQRHLDRLVYPIQQWVVLLEEKLSELVPRGRFVKLNTDAMVRVDLKTKTEVQGLRLRHGLSSVNEERVLDDRAPIGPDGDQFLWPPMSIKTTTEVEEPSDA